MNKIAGLLLMAVLLMAISDDICWSYPIADTLQYPLDSYVVGANYFGAYNKIDNYKWHLGDDCNAVAETRVYAIGNGIVRHAKYHGPYWKDGKYYRNYGGMYIVEHNVNGEKVCALYVHMNFVTFTKTVGLEVVKGEYLGQVGNREQNGDYPIHFHFGIRKGAYPENPNAYIYGDWIFSGYTSNQSVLNDWHNPSDFIAAHSQPSSANFWQIHPDDDPATRAMKIAYAEAGGEAALGGNPNILGSLQGPMYYGDGTTYVSLIKVFNEATKTWSAIIYNVSMNRAFVVRDVFYTEYINRSDSLIVLHEPIENQRIYRDEAGNYGLAGVNYWIQRFSSGKALIWTQVNDESIPQTVRNDINRVRLVDTPSDFQSALVQNGVGGSNEIIAVAPPIIDPNKPTGPITVTGKVKPLIYGIPTNGFALGESYELTLMITNSTNTPVWNFYGQFFPANRNALIVSQAEFSYAGTVYPGQSVLVSEFKLQIAEAESKHTFAIGGQVNYNSNGSQTEDCSAKFIVSARSPDQTVVSQTAPALTGIPPVGAIGPTDLRAVFGFVEYLPDPAVTTVVGETRITYQVTNLGSNWSPRCRVAVSDQFGEVPPLAPGTSYQGELNFGQLPAGTYDLTGILDPDGLVADPNSRNNQQGLYFISQPAPLPAPAEVKIESAPVVSVQSEPEPEPQVQVAVSEPELLTPAVLALPTPNFDTNDDEVFNIEDPIGVNHYLYWNCPAPKRLDRADFDGNGVIDIQDLVIQLQALFNVGVAQSTTGQSLTRLLQAFNLPAFPSTRDEVKIVAVVKGECSGATLEIYRNGRLIHSAPAPNLQAGQEYTYVYSLDHLSAGSWDGEVVLSGGTAAGRKYSRQGLYFEVSR